MSLKKIAEMTGASPSTVSRVLNNSHSKCASEQLKTKIWQAAQEIHYVPNASARNLKLGQTQPPKTLHIRIVLARVETLDKDPFFQELYRGLECEIFQKRFTSEKLAANTEEAGLKLKKCDGLIILGRCSSQLLQTLSKHTPNMVGIWRNPMNYEIDEVVCDGQKAAQAAVTYLIQKGHKKIGYIGDCSYESRYIGYSETMIRNQLSIDYSCIVSTGQSKEEGFQAMEQLLADEELTAVLCANDITAVGALLALKKRKGHRNRKISVISIDNIEEAQTTSPLLTTVHIPREAMAHMAVQILHDRILHGHTEKLRVEFPCRIIERDSCFPV
ncbi:MAG: LacI family transcriptional regulator [Lachnospiraceae bacterium]|nr:LacI family transcriptional regulator [Lachnospiraceae bacterium]